MTIMLLYHCPSSSLVTFDNTLESLLSDSNRTNVVLGNFNIDILSSTNANLHVLSYNTLLVNGAADISGTLIDHAYNNETKIVSIYFSDHGTVKFKLQKK